jgi:PEGA domain
MILSGYVSCVVALTLAQTPAPPPTATAPVVETVKPKSLLPAKTGPRLFAIDLVDKGAGPEATGALSQAVQGQAVQSHKGEVVTATQVKIVLDANSIQQMLGCDSENCMADLGKLVEADVMLGGNVAKVADDFIITLTTVDPQTGARIKQEQRKVPGNKELYYYAAKQMTSLLLTGKSAESRVPVALDITDASGTVSDAQVLVDGKSIAAGATTMLQLDPGQHEVIVKKPGFVDWRTLVDVAEGTPQQVTATLTEDITRLWPAALTAAIVGTVMLGTGLVMADYANGEYDGSAVLPFFNQKKENSYALIAPVDEADLCARANTIWTFSGRTIDSGAADIDITAPGAQKDGLFVSDRCGVPGGPGVGGFILIGSTVPYATALVLMTVDLINVATAE